MCHVNTCSVSTQDGSAVLDGDFSIEVEESSGEVFSVDEISRLHNMMLNVFLSQGHAVKNLLCQNMVIF